MRVVRGISLSCAVLIAAPAHAASRWTFCVGAALGGKDVWITDVFPASAERERLENELKTMLTRQGGERIVAQCPEPLDDKTAVVNAQTTAEDFNRKLGKTLHLFSAPELLSRR